MEFDWLNFWKSSGISRSGVSFCQRKNPCPRSAICSLPSRPTLNMASGTRQMHPKAAQYYALEQTH
jgi:hypothetical protein